MAARKDHQMTPHRTGWSRRAVLLLCMALIVMTGQRGQGQGTPPGLNYFKNFFVTGNYVVAGIDFGSQSHGGGLVTGTIHVVEDLTDGVPNIVPPDADIVAAFLYWQTIIGSEGDPTVVPTFRGEPLTNIQKQVVAPAPDPTFSPCWSGGGQGTNVIKTWRADVRRFLPVALDDNNGVPLSKILVNDADLMAYGYDPGHDVELPDNGTGNQTPQTAGASLVIIYRLATETLKSVVLYDGLQVKLNGTPATTIATQTLRGFYDAPAGGAARLSLLVGTGAKNATEQVKFGSTVSNATTVATNPFFTRDTNSPGSDRAWDSRTWAVTMPTAQNTVNGVKLDTNQSYGEQVTVQVTHTDTAPYDCIATSAMILSTQVVDTDFDGLLDVWETGDVSGDVNTTPDAPLIDPDSRVLPNLRAMGASKTQQDIFIELGYMRTDVAYNTPLGNTVVHTHRPSQAVLDDVAAVFAGAAQRRNPANTSQTISTPIKVHFDVGNLYQASANVIKYTRADGSPCTSAMDTQCLARGGEEILEEACVGPNCTMDGFRGVVGWKNGFRQHRDKPLNATNEANCVAMGAGCIRRFDENRRHMFRYGLLAHALGVDRPENPGIPRSVSGVADAGRGGGDFMVTLGLWDGNTGTEFMQKAAMLHEFGHTGGLRHSGELPTSANHAPNCKPNYQSVMNYLYLVRGLPGVGGTPFLDYSRQVLKLVGTPATVDLDESAVTENALRQGNANAAYAPRWYAPKTSSLIDSAANTSASTRHCDGTPLDPVNNPPDQIEMVRVGGISTGAVDWNANGTPDAGPYPQDINFNGDAGQADSGLNPHKDGNFTGWNDWEHLDLRQTAARRTPSVLSLEISYEDLSSQDVIDTSWIDTSWIDTSWIDTSWIDTSWIDTSWIDTSWIDTSWIDTSWGETDEEMARSQGPGPNSLRVASRTSQSITLEWTPPTAGGPVGPPPNGTGGYEVWKAVGLISATNAPDDIAVGLLPANVCTTTPTGVVCRYVDNSIQNNGIYQYFIVAAFASGQRTRSEVHTSTRQQP